MGLNSEILDITLKTFVESAKVLCLAADENLITFYVNPYYEQIHSITLDEAKGKHISEIIGKEGFNDNVDCYKKTLEGNTIEYSGSFNKIDGSIHHYKAIYSPIYKDDKVVGITGVVLDTTAEIEITKANKELEKVKKELEYLASTDVLTNLYNRRFFNETSENIFNFSFRNKDPISIIILDIDNFKKINDTYGHIVGDEALINLANLLKKHTRESDILCRWGGEEFTILLPKTSLNGAEEVSEKIRSNVENFSLSTNDTIIKFTISLGLAEVEFDKESHLLDTINRADKALYIAKGNGKNRVELSYYH